MEPNNSLESLKQSSPKENSIDRRKLQLTIDKLYKKNYNKLDPNSFKYLEFQSFHHATPKELPFMPKPLKSKDKTFEYLKKNHVSLKQGLHICELPKSPWGCHRAYNENQEFCKNHFKKGNEDDSQMNSYNKKLRLYKKIVNQVKNKDIVRTLDYQADTFMLKTPSGNMYCNKEKDVEQMYERVNQKFRRIRLFTFENTEDVKKVVEKSFLKNGKRVKSSEVTNRLYTPYPKPEKFSYITEKYKELWVQDESVKEL
jgi:hypothetical protein